jgi:serine/threonine-protein kinase
VLVHRRESASPSPDALAHVAHGRASLALGAAGAAWSLARAGHVAAARRWLRLAHALADAPEAFTTHEGARTGHSVFYGPLGLRYVDAYVTGTAAAVGAFDVEARRLAETAPTELVAGLAGILAAARSLAARSAPMRALVRDLVARIAERARPHDAQVFADVRSVGMAHGLAGIYLALLRATEPPGPARPGWLVPALSRLLELERRDVVRGSIWPTHLDGSIFDPERTASWCLGSAGHAILFARAYQATGRRELLGAARRAAAHVAATGLLRPSLCCGLAGQAYAMSAVARVDPGRGWRRQARTLAALVVAVSREDQPGLFFGGAGTFALFTDLTRRAPTGFPLVDDPRR